MAIRRAVRAVALLLGAAFVLALSAGSAAAATLPSGFQDTVALPGLHEPTAFRFAPNGRVFVAEKWGKIVSYNSLDDETPTLFANLSPQVYDHGDRGLLGLAVDPAFPVKPYVYALYTFDHVIGEDAPGAFPRWGDPDNDYVGDHCPKPSDADVDDCPVSGRLVRLTAVGDHAMADGQGAPIEDVMIEDWCQQNSSHSIGDLEFGPEGALFASGGDGASFFTADYGQFGWPQKNQCGDPPGTIGEALAPPQAEGGSLRSQDVRTLGDPTGLNGSIIRIDPETAAGLPDNPFAASADPNARRIVAFGFRNPFRFAIDTTTDEVYANNVGGGPFEEIDRFSSTPSTAYNSGWPCYEAMDPNPIFQSVELDACESLYDEPDATSLPFFHYRHHDGVTSEDSCPTENGSAISGSTFYTGSTFPPSYKGAFFFADSVFGCIFSMFADADGRPDPSTVTPFLTDGGLYPGVDIQVGPEGDLYYATMFGPGFGPGSIHRVSYFSGNQPPVARLSASPQWGADPLNAQLDATASSDADGEQLAYEWDLNGDGTYAAATPEGAKSELFAGPENHTVAVRVSDEQGARSVARVTLFPGDTPPEPEIVEPLESSPGSGEASLTWGVGQEIDFAGVAHDTEDNDLPDTRLDWSSRLYHCPGGPSSCHAHPLQAFPSVASDSLIAPDHDYPAHIELRLTATDSRGLSATRAIDIYPRPVDLEIVSSPPGLPLTVGLLSQPAPFTLTAIEGSNLTLSAPQSAELGGESYSWQGWSDNGARVHTIVATGPQAEYTASYLADAPPGEENPKEETPPKEEKPLPTPTPPAETHPEEKGPPAPSPPPATNLGGHPRRVMDSRTARFRFASTRPDMLFRCKLDDDIYRPCRSPRTYRRLAPGRHVFMVFALENEAQADSLPVAFRWRVCR